MPAGWWWRPSFVPCLTQSLAGCPRQVWVKLGHYPWWPCQVFADSDGAWAKVTFFFFFFFFSPWRGGATAPRLDSSVAQGTGKSKRYHVKFYGECGANQARDEATAMR